MTGTTRSPSLTRRAAVMALATTPIALAGCSLLVPHWTYRYRLTVEVEDHGRVRSGSSVIEVRRERGPFGIAGKARGEAVAVDLSGGTLFALLRGEPGGVDWLFTVPHHAFARALGGTDMVDPDKLDRLVAMQGASAVLAPKVYPTLVRFRDIRDPKSVEAVDPGDLAKSFGPGVKLRRITITVTDEPVTTGIEKRLGWLPTTYDRMLDGSTTNHSQELANRLTQGDFQQGAK